MPQLKVSVTDRTGALGGNGILRQKLTAFTRDVTAAQLRAADVANQVSKSHVRRLRDLAPPRAGRHHGLKDAIRWRGLKGSGVGLALNELNEKFPPWIVQEIGTGQRAIMRVGGSPNPAGRPTEGASYVKTVKSQRGRRISPGLVFASRGGKYSPPGSATGQQLYLRSQVRGAPVRFDRSAQRSAPGIRISREIKGQHFIREGAQAGFREYRQSVLAAARSQLKKRRTG